MTKRLPTEGGGRADPRVLETRQSAATSTAATAYYSEVMPGSFIIERYACTGPKGGKGVQWCVHRVEKDGSLSQLYVGDTRLDAARWLHVEVGP